MLLEFDRKQMAKLQQAVGHIKDGVPRVLAASVNRALSTGKSVVKKEIRKMYLIKAKDIPIAVERATFARPKGAIIIRQGMLPLAKFPFTPHTVSRRTRRRPLFAKVRKGGGGIIRTGFVAAMTTGHVAPFKRVGQSRLPIKAILTVGAPIMATQPQVGPAASKAMGDTMAKRIDHEIIRVMNREGGKK
jgi:hypothetical protein